jgi:hypothetical protein
MNYLLFLLIMVSYCMPARAMQLSLSGHSLYIRPCLDAVLEQKIFTIAQFCEHYEMASEILAVLQALRSTSKNYNFIIRDEMERNKYINIADRFNLLCGPQRSIFDCLKEKVNKVLYKNYDYVYYHSYMHAQNNRKSFQDYAVPRDFYIPL